MVTILYRFQEARSERESRQTAHRQIAALWVARKIEHVKRV